MFKKSKISGFTLIELMLVVGIIGILAAIAIPNFLKYQAKAKQTEAKSNVKGIHTVESTYFTENNFFTAEFSAMQWIPVGPYKYCYFIGGSSGTYGNGKEGLNLPTSDARNAAAAGAGVNGFTALAWGNIDSDIEADTWQITDSTPLTNTYDDVKLPN